MAGEPVAQAHVQELDAFSADGPDRAHIGLEDLSAVPLEIAAELGRTRKRVRDVLELKVGSIVTLDKVAGEMADVTVNGLSLARGEVVVIGDVLHVRIAEISAGRDRQDRTNG